jgi:hypothetical protein
VLLDVVSHRQEQLELLLLHRTTMLQTCTWPRGPVDRHGSEIASTSSSAPALDADVSASSSKPWVTARTSQS